MASLRVVVACLLAVSGIVFWASQSVAADGDAKNYVRLGVGYSDAKSAVFHDRDCMSTDPAALFGCADGPDGNPIGAYGGFGGSVMFEGAWGRSLTGWLRGEIALSHRPDADFSGQSNFSGVTLGTEPVAAKGRSTALMANLYFDLPELLGFDGGRIHPFVSGGAGVAFNHVGTMTYLFPSLGTGDATITPPGSTTHFAWALGAGAVVDVSDNLAVELAYRYVDLGNMETEPGDILIIREGRDDLSIPIDATRAPLRAHEFLFSLIYRY